MFEHPENMDDIITRFYHDFQDKYNEDKGSGEVQGRLGNHLVAKSYTMKFPINSKQLDNLMKCDLLSDLRNLQVILPEKCHLFVVSRSDFSDSLEIIW